MVETLASTGLQSLGPVQNTRINVPRENAIELSGKFNQMVNDAIANLNNQHHQVNQLNEQFVRGELNDVHQLMIASAKAELGLQLTVQVRNKAIESYQEIMRMQM
ncbi:flagellar hook-basal body complex protein FliE [Paenibacillus senegalensis]|uniref:flagellar hook-basal body complex protein FliE n=1 Tax=Paenibacillus senegalensis TaxID=1465766 RepID=UPI00028A39A3|nr:flagellar hook-basal body complex protein FliE [Paenibacillus senegalensis]